MQKKRRFYPASFRKYEKTRPSKAVGRPHTSARSALLYLLDLHGFDDHVFVRCVATVGLYAGDFIQNFEAFVELAEHGVTFSRAAVCRMVQEVNVFTMDDEELGTDGVGHHGLCPTEGAAHVGEARIVLVADGGARAACSVTTGTVTVGEVAALDHEARNDAVERSAIVLALLGQFDKVGCAFADAFFEKTQFHHAVVGGHNGDGFACLGLVQLIKSHGISPVDYCFGTLKRHCEPQARQFRQKLGSQGCFHAI